LHLIKEAQLLTGSPGRAFSAWMHDGAVQRLRIGFDGYMLRVEPEDSQPAVVAPTSSARCRRRASLCKRAGSTPNRCRSPPMRMQSVTSSNLDQVGDTANRQLIVVQERRGYRYDGVPSELSWR
jgi:hypothetical protein